MMALLCITVLNGCSSPKSEPLYFDDGIVNLMGPWEKDTPFPLTTDKKENKFQNDTPGQAIVLVSKNHRNSSTRYCRRR